MFRKLCGEQSMRNVILTTTMWDTASNAAQVTRFEEREQELKDDFWLQMLEKGSHVSRFENTTENAMHLVEKLVGKPKMKLDIQRELVDQQKQLVETAAGACVDGEPQRIKAEHQRQLDQLKEELKNSEHIERPWSYHRQTDSARRFRIDQVGSPGGVQQDLQADEEGGGRVQAASSWAHECLQQRIRSSTSRAS